MANIKQVAERAGVSTATVSKYLNGVKLREKNRRAIEAAIRDLDFKVNEIARGLRTNKSMTVGVLIPELDNLFATSIISVIENRVGRFGYSTMICDYQSSAALERQKLDFLLKKKVDGIIAMPTHLDAHMITQAAVPIVFIDRRIEGIDCDCVLADNYGAAYEATLHLIEHGHTDIGILCGPEKIYTTKERLRGYLGALGDHGIVPCARRIRFGNYDLLSGYEQTVTLMTQPDLPTALLVTNHEMTAGALLALYELELEIEKDISFIGFDNLELAQLSKPRLTIVAQPVAEIGRRAAEILIGRMQGEERVPVITQLPAELLRQKSVLAVGS